MSLFVVAYAAVLYFNHDDAVTITAIGGAESGYALDARGDRASVVGRFDPAYWIWSCDDYTSFGWAQVNLRWNFDKVEGLSGIGADPCALAQWLFDADNCARAARSILASQGFNAWSTFRSGSYKAFVPDARAIVDLLTLGGAFPGPVFPVDPPFAAVAPPGSPVAPPVAAVAPP